MSQRILVLIVDLHGNKDEGGKDSEMLHMSAVRDGEVEVEGEGKVRDLCG